LPIDILKIDTLSNRLNAGIGHIEEMPFLNVLIPRKTLEGLILDAIDPSDSMNISVHRMILRKGKGSERIEVLKESDLPKPF